ncbi:MAG: thioredoxin-dependent thiol peroxidase [Tannerellaceae bacterium]|jgi:peroxiredoxin Q/BCP|nr:thioredoxin-dependent thiol peroxidase [Tannerellaceae bacterium]
MALKEGDRIPDILGINQNGKEIKASDFAGKKLILYFYPKDSTAGCTAEACSFRDSYSTLIEKGYRVLGVSADSEKSHVKFIEKQQLPFDLIADTGKTLAEHFGVWGEKSMYGRTYQGMFRTTFLVGEDGAIERIFRPKEIKTGTHAAQILASENR